MRTTAHLLAFAAVAAAALSFSIAVPGIAGAQDCPDVEVAFARGTTEAPGVGNIGQAFVDSVRSKVGGRSVGVYAVNYPASQEFDTSAPAGGRDLTAHVHSMAINCPNTRMVLGGYSQGSAVVDLATTWMEPQAADHVAAVAEFGSPRSSFADSLSAGPPTAVGPLYTAKTIDLCVPGDPICYPGGIFMFAHSAYLQTGMVDQAAVFAAERI